MHNSAKNTVAFGAEYSEVFGGFIQSVHETVDTCMGNGLQVT
jgi:hypothetical protein